MLDAGRKRRNSGFAPLVSDLASQLVESSPARTRTVNVCLEWGEKKRTHSQRQSIMRMYCFGPRYERYEWLG